MSPAVRFAVIAVAAAAASVALPAQAAYVPVFGGPTYDPATGNGSQSGTAQFSILTSGIHAYNGIAIGSAYQFLNGSNTSIANGAKIGGVPIAWGVEGIVPLQTLGQATNGAVGAGAHLRLPDGSFVGSSEKFVNGQSVGPRSVRWTPTGQISEMAYPGAASPLAAVYFNGNSANGTLFGTYRLNALDSFGFQTTVYSRPARWSADGTVVTDLGVLGTDANGNTEGNVAAVNQAGTATGVVSKYVNQVSIGGRAVRWEANSTTAIELPLPTIQSTLAANTYSSAINESGTIVGVARFDGSLNNRVAVRWNANSSTATVLDGINTTTNGQYGYNAVYAMNDAGTVVGLSSANGGVQSGVRAARWDAGAAAITVLGLLGNPAASVNAYAFDINNAGLTVGMQRDGNQGGGTAILWGLDGLAVDLNAFIDPASNWRLVEADSISDTNWVAGTGLFDPDGTSPLAAYNRPFLIQVPEPAMAGLAILVVAGLGRRKRARSSSAEKQT